MKKDHGYNPPPVWTITGAFFAKMHPAIEWYMKLLSCLDIGLFAAMFGMLAWAFGWRVMCLALVFWGTQAASPFYWTGGAFLRQDWLFYLIASVCMARKKKYFWSGAFLSYSTLLRGFPVLFFAGWVVTAAAHFWRTRHAPSPGAQGIVGWLDARFGRHHRKLAAGALVAAMVLVPTSVALFGARSWPDFAHQIGIHTELSSTNRMGWQVVVEHGAEGRMQTTRDNHLSDPFAKWKAARRDRLRALRPIYIAGIVLAMGAFVYACWRVRTPWVALALGCVLPAMSLELACYYYSYFLLCATLARGRRPMEFALLAAAALSEICAVRLGFFDDRFTAMSLVFLELALFAIVLYARPLSARTREATKPVLTT
jgi:multidrug transporter EmrE-like cation transporter